MKRKINLSFRFKKKHSMFPTFITGCFVLRDKIGPITINYNPKANISFNSVQAHLLGKIMLEYLSPDMETTFVDLGCNYGVLSLMLAHVISHL
jgi:tRNA/tmRNA/rRNA uracil-C5-methylase (TrmA/RlmC/RlmD family)